MLKYILLVLLGAIQCYGMENENKITVERINSKEVLQKGLQYSFKIFDILYGRLDKEQQKNLDQERNYLKTNLSIDKSNNVFIKEKNIIIGFLASHLAQDEPDRIIFDNIFLGNYEKTSLVYQSLFKYIKEIYPEAKKIWFALLTTNETISLAQNYNFVKSSYMDNFHQDKKIWQGWEKEINIEQ